MVEKMFIIEYHIYSKSQDTSSKLQIKREHDYLLKTKESEAIYVSHDNYKTNPGRHKHLLEKDKNINTPCKV